MYALAKRSVLTILLKQNCKGQSDIARELSVVVPSVTQVLEGKRVGTRIRAAITKAVGQDHQVLWPSA